MMELL